MSKRSREALQKTQHRSLMMLALGDQKGFKKTTSALPPDILSIIAGVYERKLIGQLTMHFPLFVKHYEKLGRSLPALIRKHFRGDGLGLDPSKTVTDLAHRLSRSARELPNPKAWNDLIRIEWASTIAHTFEGCDSPNPQTIRRLKRLAKSRSSNFNVGPWICVRLRSDILAFDLVRTSPRDIPPRKASWTLLFLDAKSSEVASQRLDEAA